MKRMYIAFAILAAVILICAAALVCSNKISDDMAQAVDMLMQADDRALEYNFERVQSKWKVYRPILSLYTRHAEVENITDSVTLLDGYLREGKYDMLRVQCTVAQEAIDHLRDSETPTIYNIM